MPAMHQPINSICEELKFIQRAINVIDIVNGCYQHIDFRQHSPTVSKLRLKYHPHSPHKILHQPVPNKT